MSQNDIFPYIVSSSEGVECSRKLFPTNSSTMSHRQLILFLYRVCLQKVSIAVGNVSNHSERTYPVPAYLGLRGIHHNYGRGNDSEGVECSRKPFPPLRMQFRIAQVVYVCRRNELLTPLGPDHVNIPYKATCSKTIESCREVFQPFITSYPTHLSHLGTSCRIEP